MTGDDLTGHALIRALQALPDKDLILPVAWSDCCPAYIECDKYHPITKVKLSKHVVYGRGGVRKETPFLELQE